MGFIFFYFHNNPVSEKVLEIRGIKQTLMKDMRILLARLLFKKLQNVKKVEFEETKITIKEKPWHSKKSYVNPDNGQILKTSAKYLIHIELKDDSFDTFVDKDRIFKRGRIAVMDDEDEFGYERTTIIPNESSDEEDPDSTKTQIAGPSKTRDNFRADLKREHSISSFGPPRKRVLPPVHARQLKPRPPKPSAQSKPASDKAGSSKSKKNKSKKKDKKCFVM
ncbi:unnamed protein product [Oikopleura dioica]|uniref:Uncharacterized protein n=1 Tax=Oikopleura dioica TaxID=34765 RepID=E4XCF7_OIKDI|nr:unnamed protein product [Oikopleura dioica]